MLVALTGTVWALLCLWLWRAGHAPSRTLVPLPREHYYLAQATFVVPLLLLQWTLFSWVSARVARAWGGRANTIETARALAPAFALPLLAFFLLPDLIAYASLGFGALAKLIRVSAPLSFVATLCLSTRALARVHTLSTARAATAALLGLLVQALLGGPLLR